MSEMQIDFLKQAATDEGRALTHARGEHMIVKALETAGYITGRGEVRKATKAGRGCWSKWTTHAGKTDHSTGNVSCIMSPDGTEGRSARAGRGAML